MPKLPGNITTFYSYKGGTGRTMALANSAWVLAERVAADERILVIDWDLEAPGLHRFFPPRLRSLDLDRNLGLDKGAGLIDLFIELDARLPTSVPSSEDAAEVATANAIEGLDWSAYIEPTEHASIHIMRAGRNDDGEYGRRVNTFDWEGLFRRAPGIYRAFAERLARDFRWVMVDSRTGVTDISGICTSLLPEKLVVVFTPNRQSLSGVGELIRRATAYRRGSDDLRPLLVLPLPSRIEASMEKLRSYWRHGNPDEGIVGYQPLFQSLLAECYGLAECQLGPYFDAVQIQQSPDCAYGEVISVRGKSGDRLSLASSYRVFVDRLSAEQPPWQAVEAPVLFDRQPVAGYTSPLEAVATASAPKSGGKRIFVSFATEDHEQVARVVAALKRAGIDVFWERNPTPGKNFEELIAEALDAADAVLVFWSRASVNSEWVLSEAGEGLRRGVLLPVLLDDMRPPMLFRSIQAADLSRDFDRALPGLLDDVLRVALGVTGDQTQLVTRPTLSSTPPESPVPPIGQAPHTADDAQQLARPARHASDAKVGAKRRMHWGLAFLAALGGLAWLSFKPATLLDRPPLVAAASSEALSPRMATVPNFVGRKTDVAQEIAHSVNLKLDSTDESGAHLVQLPDGLVTDQLPVAGTQVSEGSEVKLRVAVQVLIVPSVGGLSLSDALAKLRASGLDLGNVESIEGSGARVGTVVQQAPPAGKTAPLGTKVKVGVAAAARPTPAPKKAAVEVQVSICYKRTGDSDYEDSQIQGLQDLGLEAEWLARDAGATAVMINNFPVNRKTPKWSAFNDTKFYVTFDDQDPLGAKVGTALLTSRLQRMQPTRSETRLMSKRGVEIILCGLPPEVAAK